MLATITTGNIRVEILRRAEVPADAKIAIRSSTEPQPFACLNYRDDKFVGGSTLTQSAVDALLAKSTALGHTITR